MTTIEKIEMTRKALMSVTGYSFSESKVAAICEENDYIPSGSKVMSQNNETLYFEDGNFVTRNEKNEFVKSYPKSALNEAQLLQLFAIWASKNI